MVKNIVGKFIDFRCCVLALAVVSAMMLSGASAASTSEPFGAPPMARSAAGETETGSALEVRIDNFAFAPGVITVKAGTQLTWTNHDDIPHTVDSTDGKFKSSALDTDDKFQFRFTEPGEYPYYCRIHPKMTGKIIVQP